MWAPKFSVYVKLGELVMHGVYSKIGRGYRGEW